MQPMAVDDAAFYAKEFTKDMMCWVGEYRLIIFGLNFGNSWLCKMITIKQGYLSEAFTIAKEFERIRKAYAGKNMPNLRDLLFCRKFKSFDDFRSFDDRSRQC